MIAVLGSTGKLGAYVIESLAARIAGEDLLALGRNETRLAELATTAGVRTARVDLDDVEATAALLNDVETLVLISVGGPGAGVGPRLRAVEAAEVAGVGRLVYTSLLQASTSQLEVGSDHRSVEDRIGKSDLPAALLRNGWYTENFRSDFDTGARTGIISNSVGPGRIASAPRRDYAEAVAIVATTPWQEGRTYELSGDSAWTFPDFVEIAQTLLGRPVAYEEIDAAEERRRMLAAGSTEQTAAFFGRSNASIHDGALALTNGDLREVLGRPTEQLAETMRGWL